MAALLPRLGRMATEKDPGMTISANWAKPFGATSMMAPPIAMQLLLHHQLAFLGVALAGWMAGVDSAGVSCTA